MEKSKMARRIWDICQEEKGLKDEKDELRADLFEQMSAGEVLYFNTPIGVHRAQKKPCKETVLYSNKDIFKIIGEYHFLEAAKVSLSSITEAAGEIAAFECIAATAFNDQLKILKGRG